jgi:hypothetical protein
MVLHRNAVEQGRNRRQLGARQAAERQPQRRRVSSGAGWKLGGGT